MSVLDYLKSNELNEKIKEIAVYKAMGNVYLNVPSLDEIYIRKDGSDELIPANQKYKNITELFNGLISSSKDVDNCFSVINADSYDRMYYSLGFNQYGESFIPSQDFFDSSKEPIEELKSIYESVYDCLEFQVSELIDLQQKGHFNDNQIIEIMDGPLFITKGTIEGLIDKQTQLYINYRNSIKEYANGTALNYIFPTDEWENVYVGHSDRNIKELLNTDETNQYTKITNYLISEHSFYNEDHQLYIKYPDDDEPDLISEEELTAIERYASDTGNELDTYQFVNVTAMEGLHKHLIQKIQNPNLENRNTNHNKIKLN